MEEYSYTSTHPLGHTKACNGNILALTFLYISYFYLEGVYLMIVFIMIRVIIHYEKKTNFEDRFL
jgi:hypothetical protein